MRIFISSTFRDLRAERDAAVEALRRKGLVPWGMELFVSEPATPLEVALDELQMSDAVVLIIGFKGGSLIPEDSTLTYTGAEFQRAQELGDQSLCSSRRRRALGETKRPSGPERSSL